MDRQDRKAIEDLFSKLAAVEKRTGPRDPEAEAFIRDAVSAQPGAPYYMAQTIIVQEQALEAARQRIEELEGGERREAGGFLSGLFGNRSDEQARTTARGRVPNTGRVEPWDQQNRGSGFLAGAAQTAMGVAGGILLGNFIAGALFGGPDAQASESSDSGATDEQADADTADAADSDTAETADADFDGGGDFGGGDFGGFDV